mmetsp:Transcript_20270/g.53315  ORF Transcript_20270/g.53315 Transcript_20270/m.53315 type:complete len:210 (+) Transcript_20270:439-1068(+)
MNSSSSKSSCPGLSADDDGAPPPPPSSPPPPPLSAFSSPLSYAASNSARFASFCCSRASSPSAGSAAPPLRCAARSLLARIDPTTSPVSKSSKPPPSSSPSPSPSSSSSSSPSAPPLRRQLPVTNRSMTSSRASGSVQSRDGPLPSRCGGLLESNTSTPPALRSSGSSKSCGCAPSDLLAARLFGTRNASSSSASASFVCSTPSTSRPP